MLSTTLSCAPSKLKKEVKKAKHTPSSQMLKSKELNIDLFHKTMKPVEQVLKDTSVKDGISDIALVGGSTCISKVQQLIKEYFKKDPSKGIIPDKVIAYATAVLGGIVSGKDGFNAIFLIGVCPSSLAIKTTSSISTELTPCNTIVPTKKSWIFWTTANNQPTILIQVIKGGHLLAMETPLLDKFKLSGMPPAQRSVPQIEVTFEIDANSILKVAASDKGT
ncbi:unnamed protein product [Rhizoctonia solani]|uniref:Uncharacterized protein n=1 Tax=Rhizoctonia solani TaxID=456999 RepID=A0A8H3AVM8_9AGAM|nr:unnamed protein product [Rhizoctonia solani]